MTKQTIRNDTRIYTGSMCAYIWFGDGKKIPLVIKKNYKEFNFSNPNPKYTQK